MYINSMIPLSCTTVVREIQYEIKTRSPAVGVGGSTDEVLLESLSQKRLFLKESSVSSLTPHYNDTIPFLSCNNDVLPGHLVEHFSLFIEQGTVLHLL